jgi:hypothetical protein
MASQTKTEVHNIGIVNRMTAVQKDRLILDIVNMFDGAEWDAEMCSDTCEKLTNMGLKI